MLHTWRVTALHDGATYTTRNYVSAHAWPGVSGTLIVGEWDIDTEEEERGLAPVLLVARNAWTKCERS